MNDTYFAAYDAVLARWPVPVESIDAPSPYGTTRVHVCGAADGAPLVLLPGAGATATVWFANVAALGRAHRVYAVDTIGDAGRSVYNGRRIAGYPDMTAWLDALLDHLGLDGTHLCGHSYGAQLALAYALHAPQRVRRLALLDPNQCFAGMTPGALLRAVPVLLRPTARRMRAYVEWETSGTQLDLGWLELIALGAEYPGTRLVIGRRPSAARLARLTVPTLVLLAEHSRVHDVRKVADSARRLVPDVDVATLPGVSHHGVPTRNPAELNRRLLEFLARESRAHPAI